MRSQIVALIGVLFLIGLLPGTAQVLAHGSGTLKLVEAPAGPYLVTIWLSPIELRAGEEMHVTVGIQLSGDSENLPVLDAAIKLQLFATGASEPVLSTTATTEQSVNKLLYESDMLLDEAGSYTILVLVNSDAGEGQTSFDIELQPAVSNANRRTITAVVFGLLAVAGWTVRQLRKRRLSVHESRDNSVSSW